MHRVSMQTSATVICLKLFPFASEMVKQRRSLYVDHYANLNYLACKMQCNMMLYRSKSTCCKPQNLFRFQGVITYIDFLQYGRILWRATVVIHKKKRWEKHYHKEILTWCLEIKSHHLWATKPEAKRIIIGGVHSLPFRVYPCQSLLVIFQ